MNADLQPCWQVKYNKERTYGQIDLYTSSSMSEYISGSWSAWLRAVESLSAASMSHLVSTCSNRQPTSSSSSGAAPTMRPHSRRKRSRRATSRSRSRSRDSTRADRRPPLSPPLRRLAVWYCTCKNEFITDYLHYCTRYIQQCR